MAKSFDTSDFRKGLKIMHNGHPHSIVDYQHVKPGKGNQFTRTKIRNLMTGGVVEINFRSGEKLEDAEVEDKTMTFLYADGAAYHFMDSKTYEQVEIQAEAIGPAKDFMLADTNCDIVFFRGRAIAVNIPQHMELAVTETENAVRGDTSTNVTKAATLETGAIVQVPAFINVGDRLKIDTTTAKYVERVSIGGK